MNFYPFHLGDYVSRTQHLSLLEDLCYRRLIDRYYLTEDMLPLEIGTIARLIGMRDHIDIVNDIVSEFFVKTDEGYFHARCHEEINKYRQKADRARVLADKRWHGQSDDTISDTTSHTISSATNTITNTNTNVLDEKKNSAAPAKPKRPRTNNIPDEDWIESLKLTYHWVDIDNEMRKIDAWVSVNPQRQKTRRFIINWLNRVEKPVNTAAARKPNKYANAW
jgi:uncharacterized protein YdaU (DUF1376 family)